MNFESVRNRWSRRRDPSPSSSSSAAQPPAQLPLSGASSASSTRPTPGQDAPHPMQQPSTGPLHTASLPVYDRLPLPKETQHPLRVLHDLLSYSPHSKKGWSSATPHATVLRQIFFSIWYKPEWLPFFELDQDPEGLKMPHSKEISDWITGDQYTFEQPWTLSGYQQRVNPGPEFRPGRACGKVLQRMERTYSCKTCAIDASCVLCVECFKASEHEGHEVLFGQSFSFATVCDCGDPSAWKEGHNIGCGHHPPLQPGESPWSDPKLVSSNMDIPHDLLMAIYHTIIVCLEFIIATLEHSLMPSELANLPQNLADMLLGVGGTAEPKETRDKGPWSVAFYSDDKHVLREVTRQIKDALGVSAETAEQLAKEADEKGRKTVVTSSNPVAAFHAASMFHQIDLGVALRLSSDIFREEIAGVMISWLADMCKSRIGGDDDAFKRILNHAFHSPRIARPVGSGTGIPPDIYELAMAGKAARRIDWFMQLDARLWKKAKWELRQVYADLCGLDWGVRSQIVERFGMNYLRMFEHYLFHDRDVDTNLVFSIAYAVFGNGAACAHATVKSDLLNTIITIAHSWYSSQYDDRRLIYPPGPIERLDPDKSVFRSKKGLTIFGHIRVMFRHEEMHRLILLRGDLLNRVLQFFGLFVGLQPQRRERNAHVEYEVEWPRTFQILGELAKSARELGEGFVHSDPDNLLHDLRSVARRIFADMLLHSSTLDPERYIAPTDHTVINVLSRGSSFNLIYNYMPLIDAFSFHRYLHLLWAEMFKSIPKVLDFQDGKVQNRSLREIFDFFLMDGETTEEIEWQKLMLLEWPVQMFVVISQIRAEMWKKNGGAMRAQSHHYRELNTREATIDQEFYILQVGLCTMDPLKFMVMLIDRWNLKGFFSIAVNDANAWVEEETEPKQLVAMLEDFISTVIHLVNDTAVINGWSQTDITQRHIVHHLALSNLAYSELVKKLPERCTERSSILPILERVATFRPPTDTAGGVYMLKDELYDTVDPYWRYYSRNEQRAATDRLHERAKRGDAKTDPLILPRPVDAPSPTGAFGALYDFMKDHVVCDIVFWMLGHCMVIGDPSVWPGYRVGKTEMPQMEVLLDLTLHLAILALQISPKNFAEHSVDMVEASGAMSIFQNLWLMQTTETFKSFRPKVDWILDTIVAELPRGYTKDYRAARTAQQQAVQAPATKTDAKITAAARQQALLQEFAAKQASFAAMMEEDMDDDEEENVDEAVEADAGYGSCIVCQEQVSPKAPGGLLALLQPSRIIRDVCHDRDWFEESLATPVCLDEPTRQVRHGFGTTGEPLSTDGYPSLYHRFGVYISACNHMMHDHCVHTYFEATRYRHTQQVQRHHPENAMRMEYLCPLCKSVANFLIPLDPTKTVHKSPFNKEGRLPTLSEKIRSVSEEGLIQVSDSARIWDHHVDTGELIPWFADTNFSTMTQDPVNRRLNMRPNSRMIERMRNLLRPLSEQSIRVRGKKITMYLPDEVVGYTVSVAEITQRGLARTQGLTVAEQIPEMTMTLIKRLIGMLQLELDIYFGPKFNRTALRVGLFARFLPDWYRASSLPNPVLLRDPLGIIIETAALAPDLLQTVIIMAYYAELTRVMLGLSVFVRRSLSSRQKPQPRSSPPIEPQLEDAMDIFSNFRGTMISLFRNAGPFSDTEGLFSLLSDLMLSKLLYSHTLPFLRRAAIVYYAAMGTYPNPTFTTSGNTSEYNKLLGLLAIPRPKETLSNPSSTELPIVARWLNQWALQGKAIPMLEFPGTYELRRLPERYEDVVLAYADVRCAKCKTKPSYPAMCLNCGTFVCLAGDCCSEGESGECNLHMRECGMGIGMFVDIKRWVLLYLYAGSGSFSHMPYLDSHGELDLSMRRGHRQTLQEGRWEELRRAVWLQHTIPHLTARRLELASDGGGWTSL